jgi:hypothetical protein
LYSGKTDYGLIDEKRMIQSTPLPWWKPLGNLFFKVLRANHFLIEFDNPMDKERVMMGRPWVFECSLLLIEDCKNV